VDTRKWRGVAERNALPSRKVIRLRGYDYSLPGEYFITVCTLGKKCALGRVDENGVARLNCLGRMIESAWREVPPHCGGVTLDEWIIMPNHIHGIVCLAMETPPHSSTPVGAGLSARPFGVVGAGLSARPGSSSSTNAAVPNRTRPSSLSDFVQKFKSITTARY
jgi:putative transposase